MNKAIPFISKHTLCEYVINEALCFTQKNILFKHKSFKIRLEFCIVYTEMTTTFLQIQNSQGGESFTMFTFDLIMGLDIN